MHTQPPRVSHACVGLPTGQLREAVRRPGAALTSHFEPMGLCSTSGMRRSRWIALSSTRRTPWCSRQTSQCHAHWHQPQHAPGDDSLEECRPCFRWCVVKRDSHRRGGRVENDTRRIGSPLSIYVVVLNSDTTSGVENVSLIRNTVTAGSVSLVPLASVNNTGPKHHGLAPLG